MLANLAVEMKMKKITQTQIARVLGVTNNSVWLKINGKTDFTASEMFKIQDTFFPDKDLRYLFEKKN